MKPEDDSSPNPLLSAYLDDELDPGARSGIEAAIEADPRVAHALRELAATRDAVAALPRPPIPRDLTRSVLAAIEHPNASAAKGEPRLFRYLEAPRLGRIVVWATAAALLLATGVIALGPRPHRNQGPIIAQGPEPDPAGKADPSGNAGEGNRPTAILTDTGTQPPRPETVAAAKPSPGVPPLTPAEIEHAKNARDLDDLLNAPDVRLILVRADELENARDRVEGLLRDPVDVTARALITLHQGVAIDPEHPNRAFVFTLVGDKAGMDRFRERLVSALPGSSVSENRPANPDVVLALGESPRIEALRTANPLELFGPEDAPDPSRIAIRGRPQETSPVIVKDFAPDGFRGDGLVQGQGVEVGKFSRRPESIKPVDAEAGRAPEPIAPPALPRRPREQTLLVWVTSTRPGTDDRLD